MDDGTVRFQKLTSMQQVRFENLVSTDVSDENEREHTRERSSISETRTGLSIEGWRRSEMRQ